LLQKLFSKLQIDTYISLMNKFYTVLLVIIFSGLAGYSLAQLTPQEAAIQMQKGINLGNTLEPPLEGGWNNPAAQEYYFDMYRYAGFNCVRIPVRWDQHTQASYPYKIDEAWLDRVEQVADWGLSRGLFIIINAHHEEWIKKNYTNAVYRERFDSIWSQIATRFKDKSEKLVFEVINEPNGLTKAQNDDLHQRIISIIRKTNPTRIIVIQGHNWGGSDELIAAAIPADNYLIGSFHSYDPYTFGLLGEGTWGSASDINILNNKFLAVKNWSDKVHIPVLLGEFGSVGTADYNSRMKHYKTYVELAQKYGFIYCAWDDGGDFRIIKRSEKKWDETKDILLHTSSGSPKNPALKIVQDTMIRLNWTNALAGADTLFIERRTPGTEYKRIAILKGDTSSFTDLHPFSNLYNHYRIIARYPDKDLYSHPVRIFLPPYVPLVREPYLGEPGNIPGVIEAENFDSGGEGFTYHDYDPANITGVYRPGEGVDIYNRNGTGYHIGNTMPGEWYEYTVSVANEGAYNADFILASLQGGGTFKVKIGEVESDTLKALNTNSALNTKAVSTVMNLAAGVQIMRFTVLSQPAFNIDQFIFSPVALPSNVKSIEEMTLTVFRDQNREINYSLNGDYSIQWIHLYSMSGLLVYAVSNPGRTGTISTQEIPEGIYLFEAFTDKGRISTKIPLSR
jgi:aryl-phospho-beta-D-glucosidase BglC (GH1 family)